MRTKATTESDKRAYQTPYFAPALLGATVPPCDSLVPLAATPSAWAARGTDPPAPYDSPYDSPFGNRSSTPVLCLWPVVVTERSCAAGSACHERSSLPTCGGWLGYGDRLLYLRPYAVRSPGHG